MASRPSQNPSKGSRPLQPSPAAPAPRGAVPTDPALAHARAVIGAIFGPPRERGFHVRYWDGGTEPAPGSAPFTLRINRRGALRRMLLPPSELSIVEAYLSGDVDVDGDLEAAVMLPDRINAGVRSPRRLAAIVRHLLALPARGDDDWSAVRAARSTHVRAAGRLHAPSRDRVAVQYHYDVGNDFYALWLDERMVYSCAYFPTPDTTLDEAQRAKLDLVCRKLRLRPGERFLDVGCGWGALVVHAAKAYGASALGITLSEEQARLARQRIAEAGVQDRARVELRDYRALPGDARFDKIASIGMVEHVGAQRLPDYFAALFRALRPGGLFLNHGIVSEEDARPRGRWDWLERRLWRRDAFIDQYVFPDGRLVPLASVVAAAEAAGFETRDVECLREHYALTLRHWVSRLLGRRDRAIALGGERMFRIWRLYMTASAHAFATARISVVQTLLGKPDALGRTGIPMTRADLL